MKTPQIKTFLLFFAICISSCSYNNKIERENEPTIYNVEEDDVEMNKAIKKARHTLDSFDYAFKNNSRVITFFGLKKKFEENGNVEHIWIGNIQRIEGEKYIGVVDNLPEKIKSVKLSDTVQIDRKEISDWMFIKKSELHGGYTIRLLRDRMTEEDRKKFDAESGMKIK